MKKKSYLSKQMIAVIVILTVIAVMVPLYFLVLKPMFEEPEQPPEKQADVYEPVIEGERRLSGVSLVGKTTGGSVDIYTADISTGNLTFEIHSSEKGDWAFSLVGGMSLLIRDYECVIPSENSYETFLTMVQPIAGHVAPSSDELIALQKEKAGKMTEEQLSEIGGWNNITITNEDIASFGIDFAQYGLAEGDDADSISFTDPKGNKSVLYMGDRTLDGKERYARFAGRNAVYKLTEYSAQLLDCGVYDLMAPTVLTVTENAGVGDYIPDRFLIQRGGENYVTIQRFADQDVLAMDRMTKSLLIRQSGDIVNYYDTSDEYPVLLYRYFTKDIEGERVIGAAKSEIVTSEDGKRYYSPGAPTAEEMKRCGIDEEHPYLTLSTLKYTDAAKSEDQAMVNILVFSEPYVENGTKYYNVYCLMRGTIVKIPYDSIPFVDKDEEYYINKFVTVMSITKIDVFSIDSTNFPRSYAVDGVKFFKESLKMEYQMDGDKRVVTASGEVLINVKNSEGVDVPDVPGGDNNVENYRDYYYHLGRMRMFANYLDIYKEDIEKVDLSSDPLLTLSFSVYGTDRVHEMKFYAIDEAGVWAFFTLDGDGRYLVKTEDLARAILGYQAVLEGTSVVDLLGPIGQ